MIKIITLTNCKNQNFVGELPVKVVGLTGTIVIMAYREGGGVQTPPHSQKFRSFEKVEPDFKLSGKCLVFLFQRPN